MVNDLRAALDPTVMMAAAGIECDSWQREMLRRQASRVLLNVTRQGGKSTTVAAVGLHTALYDEGSLTLMLSPTQRQSSELFRKALALYRALGKPVPARSESALSLELETGSRIVALPGAEHTVRGYSGVQLLIIDEASRVSNDMYLALRPMLAVSQGRLIALSTPFGTRGFFYEEYLNRAGWDYYEIPATMCPRITPEFLEEERRRLGQWWFEQEYMCKFLDSQTSAFRQADIEAAF
jgi:hypothetical protein